MSAQVTGDGTLRCPDYVGNNLYNSWGQLILSVLLNIIAPVVAYKIALALCYDLVLGYAMQGMWFWTLMRASNSLTLTVETPCN